MTMASLLEIDAVRRSFGGIVALDGASFAIEGPGIYGVIGPNGAGKTTLFDIITGLQAPDDGTIRFAGADITGSAPHRLYALGIARSFQECRIFPTKTCLENLLFAVQRKHLGATLRQAFLRRRSEVAAAQTEARRLLAMVRLEQHAETPASALSFGQKRLLELASLFMIRPRLLLLDEPASGVNPALLETLTDFLLHIRAMHDTTLLIVEHNMEFIMNISERIVVMHQGAVLEEGSPAEVQESQRVIDAYLG
jgi:neutral amino acid transport system ATP-binding protein